MGEVAVHCHLSPLVQGVEALERGYDASQPAATLLGLQPLGRSYSSSPSQSLLCQAWSSHVSRSWSLLVLALRAFGRDWYVPGAGCCLCGVSDCWMRLPGNLGGMGSSFRETPGQGGGC